MVAAPSPSPDAIAEFKRNSDATFDALIAERGGTGALSVADCGILRKLAKLLASPSADPRIADAIARLTALVPPPQPQPFNQQPMLTEADLAREDLPWDLTRLNDAELDELDRLHAVATGRALPVPNRRRDAALALVRQLDGIERENGGIADEAALNLLRGDLQGLLFPIVTLGVFAEPYIPCVSAVPEESPVRPSEGRREVLQQRTDNVVPLPSRDASWAGLVGVNAGSEGVRNGALSMPVSGDQDGFNYTRR
jgi:hypothetical protein